MATRSDFLRVKNQSSDFVPKPVRQSRVLDESSLELLEHLISIVLEGNSNYLKVLLQNDEILQVVDLQDNKGFTPLHIASERGEVEIMRLLLEAGADPNLPDRFKRTPLHWVLSGGCHCDFCNSKRARCTDLLLRAKGNLNACDEKGETPLYYATKNMFHKSVLVMIEYGADINITIKGRNIGHMIVDKIPNVMSEILDKSVSYDEEDNSKLKIDFKVFINPTSIKRDIEGVGGKKFGNDKNELAKPLVSSNEKKCKKSGKTEMELLKCMLSAHEAGREILLSHPVTQTFLHLKWKYIRTMFWLMRFFYSSLVLIYTYFIFNLYILNDENECLKNGEKLRNNGSFSNNETDVEEVPNLPNTEFEARSIDKECDKNLEMFIIGLCIAGWAGLMILNEIYELCHDYKTYFTSGINLGWWILIILISASTLPIHGIILNYELQYIFAGFGVFWAWAMNLAHLNRIPHFGIYIEMLGKVLRNVLLVFFTYVSLFIAFVLGFCIIFQKSSFFNQVHKSAIKSFLIMMGDRDYAHIFNPEEEEKLNLLEFSIPAHIFYIVFLVLFGIVLMNLLMALAVTDIQDLIRKAEITSTSRQINEISILESFLSSKIFFKCFRSFLLAGISVNCRNGRYFTFSAIDPDDKSLPASIKNKFIPLLLNRQCLNRKETSKPYVPTRNSSIINEILFRNSSGSNRGNLDFQNKNQQPLYGSKNLLLKSNQINQSQKGHHQESIDDILAELKTKFENLRRRNIITSNSVYC